MSSHTLTIEEVESEFSIWRGSKKGRSIPEALCKQVKILLASYHHNKVLKRLGLTLQQARDKDLLPSTKPVESHLPTTFIKIPMVQPAIHVNSAAASLTLQRGDTQLSLNSPSDEQLQLIINTLFR